MKLLKPRNLNISSYTTSNTGTSNEDVYESENMKISGKSIRREMAFKILLNSTQCIDFDKSYNMRKNEIEITKSRYFDRDFCLHQARDREWMEKYGERR